MRETRTGREEVHKGFWWGNLKKRKHVEDWAIDGMMILKWIFKKSIERGRGLDYCCSG